MRADARRLPCAQGRERHPAQPELLRAPERREAAAVLVALAPESAVQAALTGSVPILVPADEWEEVAEAIDDVFLGDASVWRRPMTGEADPFGVRLRVCALPLAALWLRC